MFRVSGSVPITSLKVEMARNQPLNPTILGDKSHWLYSAYREHMSYCKYEWEGKNRVRSVICIGLTEKK